MSANFLTMTECSSARRQQLRQRWVKLLPGHSPEALFDAYSDPGRAYHNLEHLEEVLAWTDRIPLPPEQQKTLQLALFYHDAVYDSQRGDNEQASADWALADLGEAARELVSLILDTRHNTPPASELGRWMVDIDLAILGADPARFEHYQQGVRAEYSWVPNWLYRRKRRQILKAFLARPALYYTEFFRSRLEAQARDNLSRALERL